MLPNHGLRGRMVTLVLPAGVYAAHNGKAARVLGWWRQLSAGHPFDQAGGGACCGEYIAALQSVHHMDQTEPVAVSVEGRVDPLLVHPSWIAVDAGQAKEAIKPNGEGWMPTVGKGYLKLLYGLPGPQNRRPGEACYCEVVVPVLNLKKSQIFNRGKQYIEDEDGKANQREQ